MASPDSKTVREAKPLGAVTERRDRRKRLPLNCGECRAKKLSCDRSWPCQRCVRSGRPEQCSFETAGPVAKHQTQRDEIRDLRAEVAQLKALLSKASVQKEPNFEPWRFYNTDPQPVVNVPADHKVPVGANTEISDPKERGPRAYYGQHALFQFFREIPQLFPFIKETTDDWLKPLGVSLKKDKPATWKTDASQACMDGLLPSKEYTDALVSLYLDQIEHLHRIVHIPTFKKEYAEFWVPERTRYPAMTALVLSMISISMACGSNSAASHATPYRAMPLQWISACDEWLRNQSFKHRKLVHYQVSCLVYLAKRINTFRKKRFWAETGSLMQSAIADGLHREPSSVHSPFMREMRRRVWAVIRELDLQNAFGLGLPTLLHNIDCDIAAPANIDDNDFDEESKEIPEPKTSSQYTHTAYQYHSSRSWELRLEISRRFSTALSKETTYEEVLKYTHEITQAIHSLPPWDNGKNGDSAVLSYAFLNFQLVECIMTIHRPFLQNKGKFWLSENVCYSMSRDVLLLNAKLVLSGMQSVTLLRDDLLLATLSLTRLTLIQPRGSTNTITASLESTMDLMEQCVPVMEDRFVRCFNGEPWCFLTMCAAIMLLKIHQGESRHTAKSSCAQRFLKLHYEHLQQNKASLGQQAPATETPKRQSPTPGAAALPTSEWLDSSCLDICVDSYLDMDVNGWDWESEWPGQ